MPQAAAQRLGNCLNALVSLHGEVECGGRFDRQKLTSHCTSQQDGVARAPAFGPAMDVAPVEVVALLDQQGKIAHPLQALPSFLGTMACQHARELAAIGHREFGAAETNSARPAPDLVDTYGKRQAVADQAPVQVHRRVALLAIEAVLALLEKEGTAKIVAALQIAVPCRLEHSLGVGKARPRHQDIEVIVLAFREVSLQQEAERWPLEGDKRYVRLAEKTTEPVQFVGDGEAMREMPLLELLERGFDVVRHAAPRQRVEDPEQTEADAVLRGERQQEPVIDFA